MPSLHQNQMELHVQHMQLAVKTNLATYTVSIFNHRVVILVAGLMLSSYTVGVVKNDIIIRYSFMASKLFPSIKIIV